MQPDTSEVLTPQSKSYRLGSVPYLNARPLVWSADPPCAYAVPSLLADQFADGAYDAALLPAFEAVRREHAVIADGICIGCDGPVFSVFLAHREPLDTLESVALDPASRTSSHLLQIVLNDFRGLDPVFNDSPTTQDEARLLIGDPAIEFRTQHARDGWQFLDLGAEWKSFTGLPFVFAVWMIDPSVQDLGALADDLRQMKDAGLQSRKSIASQECDPAFAWRYLTENITFDLNDSGKASLRLYASLLRKGGLVPASPESSLEFI
ncbi:MAG: menaquinone biosynthetic enzyme MqnA/MqnD family protein [Chthoniobacterales bacterium]